MSDKKSCGICNEEIDGWGNNPAPFDISPVCNSCDNYITATRIILIPLTKATIPTPTGRDITERMAPVLKQVSKMLQMSYSISRAKKQMIEQVKEMKEDE